MWEFLGFEALLFAGIELRKFILPKSIACISSHFKLDIWVWPNFLVRSSPWLCASSVENKTNLNPFACTFLYLFET